MIFFIIINIVSTASSLVEESRLIKVIVVSVSPCEERGFDTVLIIYPLSKIDILSWTEHAFGRPKG